MHFTTNAAVLKYLILALSSSSILSRALELSSSQALSLSLSLSKSSSAFLVSEKHLSLDLLHEAHGDDEDRAAGAKEAFLDVHEAMIEIAALCEGRG